MNNCLHAHVRPKNFRGLGGIDKPKIPKWSIAMKLILFLTICCGLLAQASVMAQKISVKAENASFRSVMRQIQQKSDYSFLVKENYLKQSRPITLNATEADVEDILPKIFEGQPFGYEIKGKVISVVDKTDKSQIDQPAQQDKIVQGTVTDSLGKPLGNVNIRVKGTSRGFVTDEEGRFSIRNLNSDAVLVFSLIGYRPMEVALSENASLPNGITLSENAGQIQLSIAMRYVISQMKAAEITVNTGYQSLSPERTTGSFTQPDKTMYNARVATDVISKLEGITSGLVFNASATAPSDDERLAIRGRSTIYANQSPLIVVDNFPYDGDINNINPNDIENITVLKDAAAASIWGARSGNGVIVITTKQGSLNQKTKISLNANTTIAAKPDLFYDPNYIPSSDFIDLEKQLYQEGFYQSKIDDPSQPVISPLVALLHRAAQGEITDEEANQTINNLRGVDARYALGDYFYRRAVNQQYSLNFSGGDNNHSYYISGGYDKNLQQQRGNSFDRITLNVNDNFSPLKGLNISLGLNYIQSKTNTDNTLSAVNTSFDGKLLPYNRDADDFCFWNRRLLFMVQKFSYL